MLTDNKVINDIVQNSLRESTIFKLYSTLQEIKQYISQKRCPEMQEAIDYMVNEGGYTREKAEEEDHQDCCWHTAQRDILKILEKEDTTHA
jgi:hypothetical protein